MSRPILLFESLAELAAARPELPLYTYVDERGRETGRLTARQTVDEVAILAGALLRHPGLERGQRALLAYPPGIELFSALLGCMYAGLIPVPVVLPVAGHETFIAIANDCAPSVILSSRAFLESSAGIAVQAAARGLGLDAPWLATDALQRGEPAPAPVVTPDAIAVLQYTSGSTRTPRGVCVTYGNIEHQLALQRERLGSTPESRYVFWLPHYHDFALISAIFGAAHGGCQLVMTSPMTFLRDPASWGELMHRYRATHTAAPDSGYRLFVDRTTAEQRASWDLSSLEILACAAEPIRAKTVDALLQALAPCGVPPTAFSPAYGLAEFTLGITVAGSSRVQLSRSALERGRIEEPGDAADAVELLGNGPVRLGVEVRIVDPQTRRELPPGHIGEIWADGPSKCAGYFGRPEETRETFFAELVGQGARWLRTGDLGAFVGDELIVTGRLKDLVILQGRNLYPQDIEGWVGDCHALVRAGHVACFGAPKPEGSEEMIVVAELRHDGVPSDAELREVVRAARAVLHREMQLSDLVLVLARRGTVSRTTSGKVRRAACRSAWIEQRIECYVIDRGLAVGPLSTGS
jgi:acyl-CoA synthetase (AMP-forming)/AMP-acid ligase II